MDFRLSFQVNVRAHRALARGLVFAALVVVSFSGSPAKAQSVSVSGPLVIAGTPANGKYDLRFSLWDYATGLPQVGTTVTIGNVAVINGWYIAAAFFGSSVFADQQLYLQVGYRVSGTSGAFTLIPRRLYPFTGNSLSSNYAYYSGLATTANAIQNEPISAAAPAASQVLTWNGSLWAPATPSSGGSSYSAGSGLSLSGTTFSIATGGVTGADLAMPLSLSDASGGTALSVTETGAFAVGIQGTGAFAGLNGSGNLVGVIGSASAASGYGIDGTDSSSGVGVYGTSSSGIGVEGISSGNAAGGSFSSSSGPGLSATGGGTGVNNAALELQAASNGIAVYSQSNSSDANVVIANSGTGDFIRCFNGGNNMNFQVTANGTAVVKLLQILGGSDVAEPYRVGAAQNTAPRPGMVVSIDPVCVGQMRVSTRAYDTTVAGILSGANGIRPGLTLRQDAQSSGGAMPVACTGHVWCLCDAGAGGPISAGDLLTTSNDPGYAMLAKDASRSRGSILGKAMSSLQSGKGYVLVLVTLQ